MDGRVVTFDCYGTLVDWAGGIAGAFADVLAPHGLSADRDELLSLHAEIEPQVQAEAFRSYRQVLQETAWRMAQRRDWPLEREACAFLADSLPNWPVFPDTIDALTRLRRAGIELAVLSNVDEDLFAGTRRHLQVDFGWIVTAEQVRAYKPAAAHFAEAERRVAGRDWLHAAQSWFHDIAPARDRGIGHAWINRQSEPDGDDRGCDRQFPDLAAFADWITAGAR